MSIDSLSAAVNTYKVIARAEAKSERTIQWVSDSTEYFRRFLGRDPPLEEITAQDMRRWIAALQHRVKWGGRQGSGTLSPRSVRLYVQGVQLLFRTLEREELIAPHPISKMKTPKAPQRVIQPFSEREIQRLLSACHRATPLGTRDYALMLALLDCGLRASELCGLGLDDVTLEDGYLKVMGKGNKERIVPFGRRTTKTLLLYRDKYRPDQGDGSFFLSSKGESLNRDSLAKAMRRVGKRAGVKGVHPQRFRHTFALRFISATGDAFRLQAMLGHTDVQMTRRYLNLASLDLTAKRFSVGDSLALQ